jgi:hypothetical protein
MTLKSLSNTFSRVLIKGYRGQFRKGYPNKKFVEKVERNSNVF